MEKSWKYYEEAKAIMAALNSKKSVVIYDVETSGFKKTDKILQFSAIKYALPDWKEEDRIDLYIKCPFCINGSEASKVNGITDELLEDKGIPENEAFERIQTFLKDVECIAGYNNQKFDDRRMETLFSAYGKEFKFGTNIDIYQFVKMVIPPENVMVSEEVTGKDGKMKTKKTASYKLQTVATYYDPDNEIQFHSSINDVEATAFVMAMAMADTKIMIREYEKEEERRKETPRQDAKVLYINLFNPSKNIQRVYVKTDQGTVFYDERKHEWKAKTGVIAAINMDGIVSQVLEKLKVTSINDIFSATVAKDKFEKACALLKVDGKNYTEESLEVKYKAAAAEKEEEELKKVQSAYRLLKKRLKEITEEKETA